MASTTAPRRRGSVGQRIAFAVGNLGQAAFYNAMSTFFITYVTTALFSRSEGGAPAGLIALITSLVVGIRILEIFLDPLLGNLVDNTRTRWGRFRVWQFIGGLVPSVLLVLIFTGLFGLVNVNTTWFIALFIVTFLALDVFYSARDISYWGMVPALSTDSHERSVYTSLATLTGSIGYNGITVIVIPVVSYFTYRFTGEWTEGQSGWTCFAVIVALLGLVTAWTVAFGTREADSELRAKEEQPGGPLAAFRAIAKNDQLLWVALSYLLYAIANVATTGVLFYQFTYVLGEPGKFSVAGVIAIVAGLCTTPLYPLLNRVIPRRWLFAAGMGLMVAGYATFILAPRNLAAVIVALVLFYLPAQTIQMTAILSMTDSIEYGQLKTGHRNEAVTLSVRPMLDKIAGALSNGIVGFIAVAAGMTGTATAADMTAHDISTFTTWAYVVPLCGIVASLLVFLCTVRIDEKRHAAIVAELEARLAAQDTDAAADAGEDDIVEPIELPMPAAPAAPHDAHLASPMRATAHAASAAAHTA
ncbi:MAG: glycoside-pentoside-hexuronide (GPH):cation symporter, partial [Bifidobacterium sp.]|nr:glycoside-pentoside-hexuronide (GPH):cation symporter [Bifidobacterium sp.]